MPRLTRRIVRALPVALFAVVAGALVLPEAAPAGDQAPYRYGDFMALNSRGKAPNTSTDSMRQVYEFDLYSLATGEKIGTAIDDIFCSTATPPPCQVFDAKTTFKLPDGTFTNHAQVSVVFDPQRPGWVLVASLPSSKGIIAGTLVVFAIIGAGLYLLVAFFVRKGKNWARILGTVFAALSIFGLFGPPTIGTLGTLLGIAAIVLLYLPAAAPYFRKQQPFANPYGGGFGSPYGR